MSRERKVFDVYNDLAVQEYKRFIKHVKARRDREERIAQHEDKMKQTRVVFFFCMFMLVTLFFISRLAHWLALWDAPQL